MAKGNQMPAGMLGALQEAIAKAEANEGNELPVSKEEAEMLLKAHNKFYKAQDSLEVGDLVQLNPLGRTHNKYPYPGQYGIIRHIFPNYVNRGGEGNLAMNSVVTFAVKKGVVLSFLVDLADYEPFNPKDGK